MADIISSTTDAGANDIGTYYTTYSILGSPFLGIPGLTIKSILKVERYGFSQYMENNKLGALHVCSLYCMIVIHL